jgi:alpha-beta hydrolase superfamily lysophospholipase
MLKDEKWLAFAKHTSLVDVWRSFVSSRKDDLMRRYTEVQKGVGELILKTMDQYAGKELPMLVVGFSAGARFTTNWIAWKPARVIAWSAQAVGH